MSAYLVSIGPIDTDGTKIRRMNDAITPFTLAVPQADLEY
jgi:hypothetical protein